MVREPPEFKGFPFWNVISTTPFAFNTPKKNPKQFLGEYKGKLIVLFHVFFFKGATLGVSRRLVDSTV